MRELAELDPSGRHAVPHLWGTTGIGHDRAAVEARIPDAPVDRWRMVFDPEIVSRFADCGVGFVDAPEKVAAAALAHLDRDPNSTEPTDIAAALEMIAAVAPHVSSFDAEAQERLAMGSLCVAVAWSGDAVEGRHNQAEGIDLAHTVLREGVPVWLDVMALPAEAVRSEAAHRLVEHLPRPEAIAPATEEVWHPNPDAEANPLMNPAMPSDPAAHPPEEAMTRLLTVRSRPAAQKIALQTPQALPPSPPTAVAGSAARRARPTGPAWACPGATSRCRPRRPRPR